MQRRRVVASICLLSNLSNLLAKDIAMNNLPNLLSLKIVCENNPNYYVEGRDLDEYAQITNISNQTVHVFNGYDSQPTVILLNKERTHRLQLIPVPPGLPPIPAPADYYGKYEALTLGKAINLGSGGFGFSRLGFEAIKEFSQSTGAAKIDLILRMEVKVPIEINGQHLEWTGAAEVNIKERPPGARWSQPALYYANPDQPVPERGIWRTDAGVNLNRIWLREGQKLPNIFVDRNGQKILWYWDGPGRREEETKLILD